MGPGPEAGASYIYIAEHRLKRSTVFGFGAVLGYGSRPAAYRVGLLFLSP